MTFLRNHGDGIAAMDFFTVPTVHLRVLYCFFIIGHDRRRVLHVNATFNPTSAWVIQQLREAFPFDTAPRYLIFDRDSIFGSAVVNFVKALGTKPCRTAFRSPWQNGVAERWIGSVRRDLARKAVERSGSAGSRPPHPGQRPGGVIDPRRNPPSRSNAAEKPDGCVLTRDSTEVLTCEGAGRRVASTSDSVLSY